MFRSNCFIVLSAAAASLSASIASAQAPPMGGPMQMYMVSIDTDAQTLMAMPMSPDFTTVELQNYGDTYSGAAAVLNGTWFNRQWGWNSSGFADLGDNRVWIELLSATPGLSIYSGGAFGNAGTFDPIFGTEGSSNRIAWNGVMLHNWYAGTTPGLYAHSYRLYVGDADGNDLGWSSAQVEWTFSIVPAPGAMAVFAAGGLLAGGRRRRR